MITYFKYTFNKETFLRCVRSKSLGYFVCIGTNVPLPISKKSANELLELIKQDDTAGIYRLLDELSQEFVMFLREIS